MLVEKQPLQLRGRHHWSCTVKPLMNQGKGSGNRTGLISKDRLGKGLVDVVGT